jgi:hypothetical protein
MTRLVPLSVVARNLHQAEYLVRSRAEQRGVTIEEMNVSSLGGEVWLVVLAVGDPDAEKVEAAHLDEDTGVFRRRPGH